MKLYSLLFTRSLLLLFLPTTIFIIRTLTKKKSFLIVMSIFVVRILHVYFLIEESKNVSKFSSKVNCLVLTHVCHFFPFNICIYLEVNQFMKNSSWSYISNLFTLSIIRDSRIQIICCYIRRIISSNFCKKFSMKNSSQMFKVAYLRIQFFFSMKTVWSRQFIISSRGHDF